MCIRDRALESRKEHKPADSAKEMANDMGIEVLNEEEYKYCLLYTSDAADERSSVDLGGRRIIKKKKQTNSERLMQCVMMTELEMMK